MISLAVVDSGGANLASILNAFERLGARPIVTRDAKRIRAADRVVLPGVGAAGDSLRRLRGAGLDTVIPALRQPVLGICLGMQLLYARSGEAAVSGLAVLSGAVARLPDGHGASVPHMGWSRLHDIAEHPMLRNVRDSDWFYFAHSFAAPVNAVTVAQGVCGERFAAAAGRGNFFAVQFHPERSGEAGARLLNRFLEWDGCG